MSDKFFSIETIKASIERLQNVKANWLIPAFVFAANGVNTREVLDMADEAGTDSFLDDYFDGSLIGLPPFETGKNLLRPRMSGIQWNRGETAGDYVVRQNTKMWGNLFSSRGYREMRLRGQIEGDKSVLKLTDAFQTAFEENVPDSFRFEDFLVWLFAFSGFSEEIESWQDLYDYLLEDLKLDAFEQPYLTRFKIDGSVAWPTLLETRPSNEEFQKQLAPKLLEVLQSPDEEKPADSSSKSELDEDDPYLASIQNAIDNDKSRAFLLAGCPGTGKTYYANHLALALVDNDPSRIVFLQFHPGFGYDDFIEGFRPETTEEGSGVRYELKPQHLLKLAERARKEPDALYVMVVDELNRGDVSRIFGEMLTYIELAYRDKPFTLSLSGEEFSLPKNIVFLATANPFDRSVTELDDALLRRFTVFNMEPDGSFLEAHLRKRGVENSVISRTKYIFQELNKVFAAGFGHSNFLNIKSVEDLADVWEQRVKLGLKRTLLYDTDRYDAVVSAIEGALGEDRQDSTEDLPEV